MSVNNWIVIQQRLDDSVAFNRRWSDYVEGFGNLTNTWLGLESMFQLTKSQPYKLRVEIQATSNGQWFSAEYSSFYLDSSAHFYSIHVSGYSGDAGDGFHPTPAYVITNGMPFTTSDKDNDKSLISNCATDLYGGGGWWFNNCAYLNLNDPYGSKYFYWHLLTDLNLASKYQLQTSRMMMKVTWWRCLSRCCLELRTT